MQAVHKACLVTKSKAGAQAGGRVFIRPIWRDRVKAVTDRMYHKRPSPFLHRLDDLVFMQGEHPVTFF